jgi:gluconolactonase
MPALNRGQTSSMSSANSVVFLAIPMFLVACSSTSAGPSGTAGTSGNPAATGTSGNPAATGSGSGTLGGSGSAGATGTGSDVGAAGALDASGSVGSAGQSASTGVAGSTGAGDTTGATGATGASPEGGAEDAGASSDAGPHLQYSCPPGPYPAQKMGASTPVCVGYDLNANGVNWVEGPTWIASQNAFFFSNFAHMNPGGTAPGNIVKVDMNGTCTLWAEDVGTNGLAVGATGNIVAACHKTRSITEFDINTKAPTIVANMYMGQLFDSPNDLVVHSNGTIYFSNPNYELGGRPAGFGPASFRIDPTGVVSLLSQGGEPNGVGLSPDEKTLYIVEGGVWTLDDNGVPTMKTNQGPPNADGFSIDCAGNIIIQGTNSSFGGPDGKTLIVVSNGPPSVKFVQMTVPGLP